MTNITTSGVPMNRFALFIVVALLAAPAAMAQSENVDTGRLDAYACEELPSPLKLDVQIFDNAPRYLRLKEKFTARLNKRGIVMTADAPLVLTLDVRTEREFQPTEERGIGELRVGSGGGVSLRGKIWSNTNDSVLGGRKKSSQRRAVDQLRVTANLNRRDDGRCVWRGEILHALGGGDPDQAAFRFMPPLADAIGQSIRNKSVVMSD
jgi:hypothetical protein